MAFVGSSAPLTALHLDWMLRLQVVREAEQIVWVLRTIVTGASIMAGGIHKANWAVIPVPTTLFWVIASVVEFSGLFARSVTRADRKNGALGSSKTQGRTYKGSATTLVGSYHTGARSIDC